MFADRIPQRLLIKLEVLSQLEFCHNSNLAFVLYRKEDATFYATIFILGTWFDLERETYLRALTQNDKAPLKNISI